MRAIDFADTFDLDEGRVAVAGDWHGDQTWAARAIRELAFWDVRTICHVGDLWPTPALLAAIDRSCELAGVERVLVTLGNHEPYPDLPIDPMRAVQISETVWVLPRPFRFMIGGASFLSLGGANSIDRAWRTPGRDWWPEEQITDTHRDRAIELGSIAPVEVMLTHETVDGTPVHNVARMLATNPQGWPLPALAYSAMSRSQVTAVWNAVKPRVLLHGHMHEPGAGTTEDGLRVISLGMNGQSMNLVMLDVPSLLAEQVI